LFVVAGGARIYKICPSTGREMTLYRVLEGQCCPLMMASVLGGSEYEASAAIEAPTEALLVPVPEFKAWIDEFPTVRQFVFKQIAGRIVDVALLAERVAFLPIPVRLADFLLVAARDQSSLRITHDRIAAELGTAREVVSRALQALASQELIRLHHGRVELLRRDLLLRIADHGRIGSLSVQFELDSPTERRSPMTAYYSPEDLKRIPDLIRLSPQAAQSYLAFEQIVYRGSSALSTDVKELIAIAVAHVTGCPYCIDAHVKKFKELGGSPGQIVEAVLVAASTRAGAILSHAAQALNAFDRHAGPTDGANESPAPSSAAPGCMC